MSFGGVVGAMITSLKNNKRDRVSALKKLKDSGVEYSEKTELHFEKKASPMQLKKIREKLQKENKTRTRNKIVIIAIAIISFIYFIGFVTL